LIHFEVFLIFVETYAQPNAFPGQQVAKYITINYKPKGVAHGDGAGVHFHSTSDSSKESSDVFEGDS